ncbi:MAG: diaminopimelate decarboxylase, partial [Proteobacteria bacterium]|nr:diaminopimelate decarboxylase [Pseudomonadota bacterium]
VECLKQTPEHNFAIVDAAMNDLIRPSLYDGWHDIKQIVESSDADAINYDVVGPVCETGDFLGKNRLLRLQQGDLLAVCSAGAYGFTMASNYNSRPRVAEVMVDGEQVYEIRKRESVDDLMLGETLLP